MAVARIDRREELLEHAERLFQERGFHNTRIIDIADAAGVAKGLVYFYFENKEALYVAVVDDVRARLQARQAKALAGIEAPLDRIYFGTVVAVKFVVENIRLYGAIGLASVDPSVSSAQRESSRAHASDTVQEVLRGQADGSIRQDEEPIVLAHGNQGIVSHFATAFTRDQLPGTVDDVARMAGRFVVNALAATPKHADAVLRSAAKSPRIRGGSRK